MCIINSISEDSNSVKIPNIVVNAVSVLIMSLNNSIKASEKFESFKEPEVLVLRPASLLMTVAIWVVMRLPI
jgi:hypothetical protein